MCVEKGHEILVEKLKRKTCADIFMNEENEQLEEDIRKKVVRDFLDMRDEDSIESEDET